MKLVKITHDHYVVVDDSEIKDGDWFLNKRNNSIFQFSVKMIIDDMDRWCKKTTHSTKPIEYIKNGMTALSLQEVKELIGELDVEKKAEEEANKLSSILDPNGSGYSDYVEGYKKGYSQAIEDNKENKFSEDDISYAIGLYLENKSIKEIIQSLQPKTEWEVEIVDGKIKLK